MVSGQPCVGWLVGKVEGKWIAMAYSINDSNREPEVIELKFETVEETKAWVVMKYLLTDGGN